jgi:hypothetical protein
MARDARSGESLGSLLCLTECFVNIALSHCRIPGHTTSARGSTRSSRSAQGRSSRFPEPHQLSRRGPDDLPPGGWHDPAASLLGLVRPQMPIPAQLTELPKQLMQLMQK